MNLSSIMLKARKPIFTEKHTLSFQGPNMWNSFPDEIKTAQNAEQLKKS